MGTIFKRICLCHSKHSRLFNYATNTGSVYKCKLLIVGGGTGGCSTAWRFSRKLKDCDIIVVEPSKFHYYQPLFTLVAAGMKDFEQCKRPLYTVLPPGVRWLPDRVERFAPGGNAVHTRCGDTVCYEFMVVAMGLENDYDQITGLKKKLACPLTPVTTIYSPSYCCKTWELLQQLDGGHAVFTFPKNAGKCSGAAQKIMYLTDAHMRKNKIRPKSSITYNTAGNVLFGVPKYAKALQKVVCDRNIAVNYNVELVEVRKKEAVFVDNSGGVVTFPFNFLHVTPPMFPPNPLRRCQELVTDTGYLDVDQYSLQHKRYANVYGIGDCTSTPNSKTAAAVSKQSAVLQQNLSLTMEGKEPTAKYDGYGACPMLTSYKKGILTEFDYEKKPCETFPFDQSKERRFCCFLKKTIFPCMYWNKLIKGTWDGPSKLRKYINPLKF